MASGGMYDHIGGGFARYSVDRAVARAALREDALRPGAAGAGLRPRRRRPRRAALAPGRRRDRRVRAARPAPARRRVLLGRGRRLPRSRRPRPRGPVPHVDASTRCAPCSATTPTPPSTSTASRTSGNFEGRSIPNRLHARGRLARPPAIEDARRRLFEAREQRPRPGLDDKVLTEWNALMISALAEAGALLDRPDWIDAAVAAGDFLRLELRRPDGRWFRSWHADGDPPARHDALAADHAASSTPSPASPRPPARPAGSTRPAAVADTMLDHFWDVDHGGLFTTPDDGEALVARQKDLFDNATPSANSTAAVALLPPRRAHRRDPLRQPRRPHPAARRRGRRPGAGGLLQRPRRRRPARARDHRGRRRRRPARPRRRRPRALAPRRRAGLGRAVRLAAVGRPRRRPRLRLPALRLPGAAGHARRPARPTRDRVRTRRPTRSARPASRRGG